MATETECRKLVSAARALIDAELDRGDRADVLDALRRLEHEYEDEADEAQAEEQR